ncbi:hypothetical protein P3T73_04420 [Kiritimatiellota bacterium B12222]|nr:hypothetical protein P3T73_04420 [Kiritimatiellota bacterium B12222]
MKNAGGNKEKLQKILLSYGGAFFLLAMLNNLLFFPAKMEAIQSKQLIAEIDDKLLTGEGVMLHSFDSLEGSSFSATQVLEILEEELPPESNRYSWALGLLSDVAAEAGMKLSITHHEEKRYVPVLTRDKLDVNSVPFWATYAVDVDVETSFDAFIQFLNVLNERLPYCSLATLEITALRSSPEVHRIHMTFEWPVLRFNEDLSLLQSLSEKGTRR